jgi:hypothetical protein
MGFSDHCLATVNVNIARPKAETCTYTYSNLKNYICDQFTKSILSFYVCAAPDEDVDLFARQMQRAIVVALDAVAPLKSRTKRTVKLNSRWFKDAAVEAKRHRRWL